MANVETRHALVSKVAVQITPSYGFCCSRCCSCYCVTIVVVVAVMVVVVAVVVVAVVVVIAVVVVRFAAGSMHGDRFNIAFDCLLL